jgi:type I restriction enzyme, S subunit
MAGDWRMAVLGDLVDFLSGGTPSKENASYWNGSIPWVSAKDMKRLFLDDSEDHVTEEGLSNGTKLVAESTVLLLTRGMTLLNDLPICVVRRPMTFNQDVKALRPKGAIKTEFLPYLLLGNKQRLLSLVDLAGHGTGRLNTDELKSLDVLVPPEGEQRAIAHILGTLDDKIELNRRMNETLEAMARALFKSWFVDFDPVRAKAEGRDPGLPQHIADLFPDSLEGSEMGPVPGGWQPRSWGDLVSLEYGKALSGYDREDGAYAVYGTNGRIGTHTEALCPHPGIIVGRKGAYRGVHFCAAPFYVIDTAFYVAPKVPLEVRWVYYELLQMDLNSMDSGSAIPSTSRQDFYGVSVLAPPLPAQECFVKLLQPMWLRQAQNERESSTLAALRDTLLPKLISGELRVKDTIKRIEALG